MLGYGFFENKSADEKDARRVECGGPAILGCSTAASLADGSLVGGLLGAAGK